jgi:hypothetical protein
MTVFCKSMNLWSLRRRATRLTTFVIILAAVWVFVVQAQAPTPPYAEFQYATLTGSGNTLTATQVPVVLAGGVTVYENLTMQFNSDANGNLTLAPGFTQIIQAPSLTTSGFKAGNYIAPSTFFNGMGLITVNGPGVTDGGATEWSLNAASGAYFNIYPTSATWYVGPIASNPIAARLSKAGITSTAYSYGIGGSGYTNGSNWSFNTLIGVSQVGNSITLVSFTRNGADSSQFGDEITYTLTPAP